MKLSTLALPAVYAFYVSASENLFHDRRADNNCSPGNNCQRGVGGTAANVKPPLSSRRADCIALNTVTVSPYTVTTTVTIGVLAVRVPTGMPQKRGALSPVARNDPGPTATTITPTVVPTYATYCKSASAYYSACSCAGLTAATTTLPTPTSTVTTTTFDCPVRRAVKRAGEALGYEYEEGWDSYNMPGIKLF